MPYYGCNQGVSVVIEYYRTVFYSLQLLYPAITVTCRLGINSCYTVSPLLVRCCSLVNSVIEVTLRLLYGYFALLCTANYSYRISQYALVCTGGILLIAQLLWYNYCSDLAYRKNKLVQQLYNVPLL